MAIDFAGQTGRARRPIRLWITAAVSALALIFAVSSDTLAASKSKSKAKPKPKATITRQVSVPLPRLSPLHKGGAAAKVVAAASKVPSPTGDVGDAIGDIITQDDASESRSREDSDAPQAPPPAEFTRTPPPMPPAKSGGQTNLVGLKLAMNLLDNNDPGAATLAAYALPDRTDIKIIDWMIATGGYAGVPSSSLADLQKKLADWPGQSLMRLRFEQALVRENPPAARVVAAFGNARPVSDNGKILLAQAFLDVGRRDDATSLIRGLWRDSNLSPQQEKTVLGSFGALLRASDHKARMDRLLYAERSGDGVRAASRLEKPQQALAAAVALVIKESSKAGAALDALPGSVKRDPLYVYSRIQVLRRGGKIDSAAALLSSAPRDPASLVDPDAWWVERRLVSRALIDQGEPKLAYSIAANHAAESPTLQAEAEFHAGWYALEFLHDPNTASRHFAAIASFSTMALSLSRAEYWMGRAAADAGDMKSAGAHFVRAAAYPTTFYGQLATAKLGSGPLMIRQPPVPSADTRARFANRELVQAIKHLTAAGYPDRAQIFYRHLGETLLDGGEIALLVDMAEGTGSHQLALQIGKSAVSRGVPVDALAFPISAIPASAKTPGIERPVVFAIARQESAFNPGAVSGAGARGLLQLMPSTAKSVAKDIGLAYSKSRLTTDPGYNATLGAAHLGDLVDDFGGSYVMTFAGYNAGASRVNQWVKAHGDPRNPNVDVVNWIEMIPFTETRNYVQRVMENLQVYRARLGSRTLSIEQDLHRGGPR